VPTARELLEQAEALMRRDRIAAVRADEEFPILTDAVEPDAVVPVAAPAVVDAPAALPETAVATGAPAAMAPAEAAKSAASPPPLVGADEQGAPSIWAAPAHDEASIADAGPDSLSPLPIDVALPHSRALPMNDEHALWQDDFIEAPAAAPPAAAGAAAPEDGTAPGADVEITTPLDDFPIAATLDATRWNLMAEDIRMQVLQRIDIFTDTGLREQLTERLKPIVDRASADLVATINQHVGQILRAYVAEAIEREIEKWRQEPR